MQQLHSSEYLVPAGIVGRPLLEPHALYFVDRQKSVLQLRAVVGPALRRNGSCPESSKRESEPPNIGPTPPIRVAPERDLPDLTSASTTLRRASAPESGRQLSRVPPCAPPVVLP